MSLFLRLLEDEDKGAALAAAVRAIVSGDRDRRIFNASAESFEEIPGAPFSYWVREQIRRLFNGHEGLENGARRVRQGLATADDNRFVRDWWETVVRQPSKQHTAWSPLAKGGSFSPYYADIHLAILWGDQGAQIRAFERAVIRNEDAYFHPGLTWSRRTQSGLALRAMPAGCIFADKGPAAFVPHDDPQTLLVLIAITNSQAFRTLVELQMAFGSYEVGVIQRTPVPDLAELDREFLAALARRAWYLKRKLDTTELTSHAFVLPALLQTEGATLTARLQAWAERVSAAEATLAEIQAEIDERCFDLYGFESEDRAAALGAQSGEAEAEDAGDEDDETGAPSLSVDPSRLAAELVDDPGLDGVVPAERDLVVRIQQVLALVWGAQAAEIEQELCGLLGVRDLRAYLRRPAGFFAEHLARWSKSRRKAPIVWPLSTASGSWTLWIYYPRLTADTLYKAVDRQVSPKISEIETRIAQLLGEQETAEGREASRIANQISTLSELLDELKTMRAELLRVAALPYRPNLDDGVQITAAPLWELFRLPRWRNELQKTWRALEADDYDWAHLARSIWPERVRERCKKDRSIAIAHDLEELYER